MSVRMVGVRPYTLDAGGGTTDTVSEDGGGGTTDTVSEDGGGKIQTLCQ